ncbi:MAG TPA: hypothetical protein VFW66_05675 [Gemmatimonadales bacterium]|nr:hypothetical protein [Gemmatimonadales bacterium]
MLEDIAAIIFIFGGATAIFLAYSPIGRALAERIRGRSLAPVEDPALRQELELLRQDVAELHERMDFTERVLARPREADAGLGAGGEH